MLPFHALGPCIHKGAQRMIGPKRKEMLFHVTQPLLAWISNITVNVRVSPPIKHKDPVRHQSRNPSGLFERRRLGKGFIDAIPPSLGVAYWGQTMTRDWRFQRKHFSDPIFAERSVRRHLPQPAPLSTSTGLWGPYWMDDSAIAGAHPPIQPQTQTPSFHFMNTCHSEKTTATTPGKVTIAKHVRKPRALLLVFI